MLFLPKKLSSRLRFMVGDTTATLDGRLLELTKVTHFFKQEIRQFTNGVYEFDQLDLVLLFDSESTSPPLNIVTLNARSHEQASFSLLHQLCDQLGPMVDARTAAKLSDDGKLSFPLGDETQHLEINNQTLSLIAGNPRRTFEITSVNLVTNVSQPYFIFNGTSAMGAQKLRLSPATIANVSVLIELIIAFKLLKALPPLPQWQQRLIKILPKVGYTTVLLLALNGYVKVLINPSWFLDVSIIALIMSGVWLAVVPMYWVVNKINLKRMEQAARRK